jgi:ABC-type nitrate/sulfonate/bicarbonate transport system permease component
MENVCKQALIPRTPTPYVLQLKASAADNTISLISFIAFLIAWELICLLGIVGPYQLVPPSQLVSTFIMKLTEANPDGGTLFAHTETSLLLALTGFGAAVVIGVPLGLLMGWYKPLDLMVTPVFDAIRPIPPIAWIPLAIIWLGIGLPAKAFIIWLAAFVPCVINSYTGIKLTNPVLTRVAEIYGASRWETFYKIGVPSAIPMVFTGLKLSLNASWTTLVAAELLAASEGLGYLIQMGRRLSRPDIIIVGMLTIGLTGALMSWGLNLIEARFASSKRVRL